MGDNKKVRPKRILPSCPAKQDPMGVIAAERRAGTNILKPGEAPPPDMILGRRNIDAFWGALPWGEASQFYKRTHFGQVPAVGVVENEFDNFVVPSGQVLVVTSVIFRATLDIDAGAFGFYTFARDDFFIGSAGGGTESSAFFFNVKTSGRSITNAAVVDTGFNTQTGYYLLNQNIADSQVPFALFVKENQRVTAHVTIVNTPLAIIMQALLQSIVVEWEGMLMPSQLYDKLRREFHA